MNITARYEGRADDTAMYLASLRLQNTKAFRDATISFPPNANGDRAGWNVIVGENGSGKSTLLQAVALALMGPTLGAEHLRYGDRPSWVRKGEKFATIEAKISATGHDEGLTRVMLSKPYETRLLISGARFAKTPHGDLPPSEIILDADTAKRALAGPYSGAGGWFSAGYGPFRRLRASEKRSGRIAGATAAPREALANPCSEAI